MNSTFSSLLSSFSQVKIVNYDLINVPDADMTVVVDLKSGASTWGYNVASIKTIKKSGRVLRYEVEVSDRALEKFGKLDGGPDDQVKTFAKWASESPYYATAFSMDADMVEPGPGNWTFKAKKSIKLDLHNMVADYLAYVDGKLAEEKAAEPAQEPAQDVAEVEPTETTVEPMTAREHKMRGNLECLLAFVKRKCAEFDAEGCQIDDLGQPIERPEVKIAEQIFYSLENILDEYGSEIHVSSLVMGEEDQEQVKIMRGDIEIDFSKFRAQVSDFRRQHHADGAWDVPSGSSIDAECARIDSMYSLAQVKAYLDHHMGPGEFWDQFEHYVSHVDHRPSPEDMDPDDVLKFVLEFSAMQTGNGRGSSLLCTQEADEILVQMNDDSEYLQRFTDRAREIMLTRMLDAAVPAAR